MSDFPVINHYKQLRGLLEKLVPCTDPYRTLLWCAGAPATVLNNPCAYGIWRYFNRVAFVIWDGKGIIDVALCDPYSLKRPTPVLGAAFAMGEDQIGNVDPNCKDDSLLVHSSLEEWLRAACNGIFMLDHRKIASRLRDAVRVAAPRHLAKLIDKMVNAHTVDVRVRHKENV